MFDKADSEDRAGAATKVTAKSFYAAGTFYEILQQFHEEGAEGNGDVIGEDAETATQMEEEEQRRVYCKWKANDILKAIKEGRTPTPGGYQQEEAEETSLPLVGAPLTPHDDLPPAPTMPSSSMFDPSPLHETDPGASSVTQNDESHHLPSFYKDSIEVNLNGNPTPVQETVEEDDDAVEEIFIPGAKAAADSVRDALVDQPRPIDPPPPYPADPSPRAIPPPAATHTPTSTQIGGSGGMFSSIFGSNKKKLSKIELLDATELTRFALAALEKGDGELGRQRLEEALAIWRK